MAMQADAVPLQEEIAGARAKRAARARAAHWAAQTGLPATVTRQIGWNALAEAPLWVYAPSGEKDQLALLTGALVRAAQMRLWIDGERIAQAIALLGDTCFENILAFELGAQCQPPEMPDLMPMKQQLIQSGATVLLASIADESIRHATGSQMHCCDFPISHPDACEVVAAAMKLAKLSNEHANARADDPRGNPA
jgi:hypothetical protein